jgi:glycosyltransferase involved in cell wall biosynthesis
MRILYIINLLEVGGAPKLLADIVPFMGKEHEVNVLCLNRFSETDYSRLLKPYLIEDSWRLSEYNPLHILFIIKLIKQYDIVHVNLFPSLYWCAIAKIISFSKVKLVYTEHSTHNRRRNRFIFKLLDRFIYHFYRKIAVISRETGESLVAYNPKTKNKLVIISNGIDCYVYRNAVSLNRRELIPTIPENAKIILQVARFVPAKDQATVIRAMKKLPSDFYLLFAGDGFTRPEMESLASGLGVVSRVIFFGFRSDIPALIKTVDYVVVSSHWEGFGLACIEGMAGGKPVIVSNVSGLGSVAKDAAMLFEHGNDGELAEKIMEVANQPELQKLLIEKGYARAMEYDISKTISHYEDMYEKQLP